MGKEMRRVGANIWSLALEKDASFSELANAAGVSYEFLRAALFGQRYLSLKSLTAIAEHLQITPETLMQDNDNVYRMVYKNEAPFLSSKEKEKTDLLLDYITEMCDWAYEPYRTNERTV